jgi:hypothetical protein
MIEDHARATNLVDVLDRVLDKGIVIDAWVRVSVVGIDLLTIDARVVVASVETYLTYAEMVGTIAPVANPLLRSPDGDAPRAGWQRSDVTEVTRG